MATIGGYLLQRLHEAGADHIFGVPGDYVLPLYRLIEHSPLTHVGTTREDTAAFAADGYARCRGIGALAVTYGVGALNVVNAVAGSQAESSPVVVISGAPGTDEQREDPLLHHRFGPFTFQREIFERLCSLAVVLDDPVIAFRQIDRAVETALRERKPVYIELPRDRVETTGQPVAAETEHRPKTDAAALEEAVAETAALVNAARSPALLVGLEVHRRSLQDAVARIVERTRLPVAATLTGKSVVGERHAAYVGVYEGAMSEGPARQVVEGADALLMLGVTLNDIDTGIHTAKLDPSRMIRASQDAVVVRHHRYSRVELGDFLAGLVQSLEPGRREWPDVDTSGPRAEGFPEKGRSMSVNRLIGRLNEALTPEMIVVSDTGDCLFASVELRVHERTEFLASAYYTTMGFAMPAALGAQIARPDRRTLILVGDGAFQMTGTELSTHCRLGLAPIVIVFDNAGYSTERFILDGAFNDIARWHTHRIGELFGPVVGYRVELEEDFEHALTEAIADTGRASLINVQLDPRDASPAMRRLGEHLKNKL